MKTIEEKAKAYDEAIERAKKMTSDLTNLQAIREFIFPELRESEDERIKKAILSALRGGIDTEKYLEKHGTNYGDVQDWLERQKERFLEPHNQSGDPYDMPFPDAQEYIQKRGFDLPWHDGDVFVDTDHITQTVANILRWADEHPKELKPAEKQDYSGLTDFERAIHRGFLCAGVENVPVTIIKETAQDCLAQQNPAWGKEDEKKIHFLSRLIEFQVKDDEYCFGDGFRMISKQEAIEMLKSLRPSWKPSEEQMEALENSTALTEEQGEALYSLIQDLKKL